MEDKVFSFNIRYFLRIFPITFLGLISSANAEMIWEPLSNESAKNFNHLDKNIPLLKESLFQKIKSKKEEKIMTVVKWEKVIENKSFSKAKVRWEPIKNNDFIYPKEINLDNKPRSFEEALSFYKLIKPKNDDYIDKFRLTPLIPTANQLDENESQFSAYTISAFSGGAAGGSGNQNYALRLDHGVTKKIQVSAIYSIADDPLYSSINAFSSQPENYWESLAGSIKIRLLDKVYWNIALESSIEAWNVGSGGPNIFNNSGRRVFSRNVIGSFSVPISWKTNNKLELTLSPGITFLPAKQGKNWGGEGDFYGNNIFIGAGLDWKPITRLNISSSFTIPLGPGYNSFNSDLKYSRNLIASLGINWKINPRIELEGNLTNAFGATPSTGILTIPSDNIPLYYAGIKYTPGALDTPQQPLTTRQQSLALGGVTVNTALIPSEGTTQLSSNFDDNGNMFGSINHSLSNIFQLEILNAGSYQNIPEGSGDKAKLINEYASDDGISTRFGGKFIILSPLRNAPIWSAARISFGRNQKSGGYQGYLFSEFINTWEITEKFAVSFNPKVAWNGISTPYGFGLGGNIQIAERLHFLPEYNFITTQNGESNGTLALRWLANDNLSLDIYISSAAGIQDIGQLLNAEERRLGARFHATY